MAKDSLYSPQSGKIYKKDGSIAYIEDMYSEIKMHINEIKHIIKASMGQYGGQYSGAATITPDDGHIFVGVRIVTDAALTCNGNVSGITNITFEAGTSFEGRFTEITIISGTIIAYQGLDEE